MRIRTFQLVVLTTGLATASLVSFRAVSAPQSDVAESVTAAEQEGPLSTPEATTEPPPPTTRPELAPSDLEFPEYTPPIVATNRALESVVRQLRAGVEEEVLLTYINTATTPFNVRSEEIIFLTDLGATGHIINAMIERDQQLQSASSSSTATTASAEPWPPAGTVAQVPATMALESPPAPEGEPVVVEEPAAEVSADYFYEYLAPYGTWVNIPEYGLCWQPGVAVTTGGWMPYGDRGRWVYTNYGWYWYSDYSWGWATFHYGRWNYNNRWGWCWAPGTVWGPSWVSWRYADAYCGWAPLPTYTSSGFYFSVGISWGIPSWCYTYVPAYNVCRYYPRNCAVPYAQARAIHGRARAYDNYAVGPNNAIHNRGIPPETLARQSGARIERAQIRERSEPPSSSVRGERMGSDGRTLAVFQPRVAPSSITETAQTRTRNEAQSTPRERTGMAGPSPNSRSRSIESDFSSQTLTPSATTERPSPAPARRSQASTTVATLSGGPLTTRSMSREESTSRDRSLNRAAATVSTPTPKTATVGRQARPEREVRTPNSSLVIIGRGDSRSSTTPSASSRIVAATPAPSTPRSSGSTASIQRTEARSASRSVRIEDPSTARPASRSVYQNPTPRTQSISTPRTVPTFPAGSTRQTTTRSVTANGTITSISRTTVPQTSRSSYTSPTHPPTSPSRTFALPSRTAPSSPAVRAPSPSVSAQRRVPAYSSPSPSSRVSAPAASRSAPSSRSGEAARGRSR